MSQSSDYASAERPSDPTLASRATFPDADETGGDDNAEATLPIAMGPVRSQLTMPREHREPSARPSFWRRFTLRKRGSEEESSATAEATATRLGAIDLHLEQLSRTLEERLDALNERLAEVWESEEQLSHLAEIQDKLDHLTKNQIRLAKSVADLRRILGWTAALVVVAAGTLGFALSQL